MTSVGVMASAVVTGGACTDVLSEPFNNHTAWTKTNGTPTIVAGRTGTCVQIPNNCIISYTIPAISESDTVTIGFAHQTNFLGAVADVCQFFSDTNATSHNTLQVATNGAVQITRGATILSPTSAAGLIAVNTWNYIECQIKLHDTAGTVTIRVNGTVVLTLTSQDTKNGGTKTVYDTVRLRFPTATMTNKFDDLYLSTGSGCTFKGDITIP